MPDLQPRWRLLENKQLPHKRPGRKSRRAVQTGGQLYDIKRDPEQTKNVAAAHPELVATLTAELEKVTPGDMVEAVFDVRLQKGDCKLQAEFLGGQSQKYPVHYLDVERL